MTPVGTTGGHEPTGEGRADQAGERPAPVISRKALAAFVWFIHLNPQLKYDDPVIARAFEAYRRHVT